MNRFNYLLIGWNILPLISALTFFAYLSHIQTSSTYLTFFVSKSYPKPISYFCHNALFDSRAALQTSAPLSGSASSWPWWSANVSPWSALRNSFRRWFRSPTLNPVTSRELGIWKRTWAGRIISADLWPAKSSEYVNHLKLNLWNYTKSNLVSKIFF